MSGAQLAQAFRLVQGGDAAAALKAAAAIVAAEPANARGHLVAGIALRELADWEGSRRALERSAQLAPGDYAPPYELAVLHERLGNAREAAGCYESCIALRPQFVPALLGLAHVLGNLGRAPEARARYEQVLAADPRNVDALRGLGQLCVRHADYAQAARLFAAARALAPGDPDLPLYVAQVLLLLGRWEEAWPHYARRDSRLEFEALAAAAGSPYRPTALEALRGARVAIVGEQGLGDILFFLRFAPALRGVARSVAFAGEARLHSILARTGAFDALAERPAPGELAVLAADLPALLGDSCEIFAPSLRAAPLPARLEAWRRELEAAGPRPWIAVTWRAGTPASFSREALSKSIDVSAVCGAVAPLGGTVFALQRAIAPGELQRAGAALGRPVHDLSKASEDPEDVLAVLSCLDRHIGVSSTNMHLAALAGATADVLVPFPPEWRWRTEGDSPWFPGFRLLRQEPGGDWSRALAEIHT